MNTVDFDSDLRGKICLSFTFCANKAQFVLHTRVAMKAKAIPAFTFPDAAL